MSTLKTNTLSNVAGTASTAIENAINGSAKAWVNFNGTGTVAIRASYNVTSITDNGTGDYTLNFTNAFADANYCITVTSTYGSANGFAGVAPTTTAARVNSYTPTTGAALDTAYMCVAIFR
jgi:hypothetical protein